MHGHILQIHLPFPHIHITSRSGMMRKRSGFEGFPSDLRLNQTSSSRTSPSLRSREIVKGKISAIYPPHLFADTFKSRVACLRTCLLSSWSKVSIVKVAHSTQHFCVFGDHADHRPCPYLSLCSSILGISSDFLDLCIVQSDLAAPYSNGARSDSLCISDETSHGLPRNSLPRNNCATLHQTRISRRRVNRKRKKSL